MEWIKNKWKKYNRPLLSFISCICFLVILGNVFLQTTYLFRNVGQNRARVNGIKVQKDLDVIYVGGSVSFGDWQPLKAWNDWGIASYCMGSDGLAAENTKAYIEYARSFQDIRFFIIDPKPFQTYSSDENELGLRNGSDSMDLTNPARYHMLMDYFSGRSVAEDTDVLSYYLDIAKYHTNLVQLSRPAAWLNRHNTDTPQYRGGELVARIYRMDGMPSYRTEVRKPLQGDGQRLLTELLEYGKQEGLTFLFALSPYRITEEEQERYNTIQDMVESYGQVFLNSNDYLEEMGIDFTTDFFGPAHVNVSGADKYTEFLGAYLKSNYSLPDRREDPAFAEWWQDHETFVLWKEEILQTHEDYLEKIRQAEVLGSAMREAETLSEWYRYASADLFDLIVVSGDVSGEPAGVMDRQILKKLGLTGSFSGQIRVLTDQGLEYANADTGEKSLFIERLGVCGLSCTVSTGETACTVALEKDVLEMEAQGIHIVVMDAYNGTVEDQRTIRITPEGSIIFS